MTVHKTSKGLWRMRYYEDGTKASPRRSETLPAGTTQEQAEEILRLRLEQRAEPARREQQLEALRWRGETRTSLIGGIAELWVAADLMARGFHVFRHMVLQSPCDLILVHGGICLRLECKMRAHGEKLPGFRPRPERFDILALVHPKGAGIKYFPEPWQAIKNAEKRMHHYEALLEEKRAKMEAAGAGQQMGDAFGITEPSGVSPMPASEQRTQAETAA